MIKGILFFIAVLLYCPTEKGYHRNHFKVYYYLTKKEMLHEFEQYFSWRTHIQYNKMTCRVIEAFKGERIEGTDGRIKWKGSLDVFLPKLHLQNLPRWSSPAR